MDAPALSTCPRCAASLRCGAVAENSHCWCFDMLRVNPVPTAQRAIGTSCLCRACLQELIDSNDLAPSRD